MWRSPRASVYSLLHRERGWTVAVFALVAVLGNLSICNLHNNVIQTLEECSLPRSTTMKIIESWGSVIMVNKNKRKTSHLSETERQTMI